MLFAWNCVGEQANRSIFDFKSQRIQWHVEIRFHSLGAIDNGGSRAISTSSTAPATASSGESSLRQQLLKGNGAADGDDGDDNDDDDDAQVVPLLKEIVDTVASSEEQQTQPSPDRSDPASQLAT